MTEYTPNYKLYKPNRQDAEPVDTTLTKNFETIDTQMKKNADNISTVSSNLETKTTSIQNQLDANTFSLQEQLNTNTTSLQEQINNMVIESGTSDAEVLQSRGEFPVLNDRLNHSDNQLISNTNDLEGRGYNLKTMGAIGDGVNDDTDAIQRTLDLSKTMGQVTVIFPPGVYKTTKKLIIYKNTHMIMSPNTVILRCHVASIFQNGENGAMYDGYDGEGNIVIEGGTLDSNILNYDYECSGINLSHAANITIRNVTIKDIYAGHAIDVTGVRDVLIENCKFVGYKDKPDKSRNYSEAIKIGIAIANAFPAFGKYDGTVTKEVTVRNCYFGPSGTPNTISWGVGIGYHAAVHDIYPNNINIMNNIFDGCTFRALRLFKFKNVLIQGNLFKNCFGVMNITTPLPNSSNTMDHNGNQMEVSQSGDTVIFTNNIVQGYVGDVSAISINGVSGVLTKNVKVVGNTFKGIKNISTCYIGYGENIEVRSNKFFDGFRALWVQNSENIIFDSNDCDIMESEMVFVENSSIVNIINNKVKETKKNGINITNLNGGFVKGNRIDKCSTESSGSRSGVFVGTNSNAVLIRDNKIPLSSNAYGIQVTSTCTNIQATNNDVNGITSPIGLPAAAGFDGIIITNPTGAKYKVTINNSNQLIATAL
ncbi:hypothetical protein J6TS2_50930 [Heyndrickxia sporothermodurans]|nr:hypothetical protein J6TS2_50930 [Heyndrickxia sporothermodurans]